MRLFMQRGDRPAALAQYETCRLALAAELDTVPEPATTQLWRRIQAEPSGPGAGDPGPSGPTPAADTMPSIERVREQQQLHALLTSDDGRIVSIVGPGGAGKTHLATRVGASLQQAFAGRVFFISLVDLAPDSDVACTPLLLRRLVETMALEFVPGRELAALVRALRSSRTLVILDNFETFIAARELLASLSLQSAQLRLLVTSRQRLGLAAEWVLRLDGLEYPGDNCEPDAARDYPAIRLFEQVARRADAGFDPEHNLPDVVRICQLVQGFPLALILAARWLPTLDCRQIARRLATSLDLLRAPQGAGIAERHASMRAVLEQSWNLLSPAEQTAFAALSVFPGTFAGSAGQTVAACALETIEALEAKSMLRPGRDGQLQIHPLLRGMGAARLRESAAAEVAAAQRHARYFLAALEDAMEEYRTREGLRPLLQLGRHLSDLCAAFSFQQGQVEASSWIGHVPGLWTLCRLHGWFREGAAILRDAMAEPGVPAQCFTRWQLWLTEALFQLGQHADCRAETLDALQRKGEPDFDALAPARLLAGEFTRLLVPCLRTTPHSTPEDIARLYMRLGQIYFYEGDRARFIASSLRSATLDARDNLPAPMATAALVLAYTPLQRRARSYAERAERALSGSDPFERAWVHELLCLYYLSRGRLLAAHHHGLRGSELFHELKQYRNWGECTSLLANTHLNRGNLEGALALWRSAEEQGARVQEAATQAWGTCGVTTVLLRQGRMVDLDEFEQVAELLPRIVDPNSMLLYHGIHAWVLATHGRHAAALDALRMFSWFAQQPFMLSIYALNGFAGHTMALSLLAEAGFDSTAVATAGRTGIRHLQLFAKQFPGARPVALSLQARYALACGRSVHAARLIRQAELELPPECDRERFAHGYIPGS